MPPSTSREQSELELHFIVKIETFTSDFGAGSGVLDVEQPHRQIRSREGGRIATTLKFLPISRSFEAEHRSHIR